jgi:butyryl-CoA dehydrogenase
LLEKRHHEYRERIRAFAVEKIEPLAARLDEEQRFPTEHIGPLTELGLMSMLIPPEYGGQEIDTVSYSIAVEEISRVCGSTGIMLAAHNSLGCFPILKFGTELQKKKFLPRAAQGELIAFGLTEPDAGSDAGGTRTMAIKNGSGWLINGSKCWITSAPQAMVSICTARTSDDPSDKRITSFLLERGTEGYAVGKKENKLGLRGSDTAFLHFDDMKVGEDALLGEVGAGFKQALITLDGGRISIGAMALGLGQGALDCALKYAAEREVDGGPLANQQGIQHILADMATELQAARMLIYEASQMKDAKVPFGRMSAMAKLYASEAASRAASAAITVLGSVGSLVGKYPAERIWRDVKLCEIGEGTSEIQRMVIARDLLKSIGK